jgi:hypothetical protein
MTIIYGQVQSGYIDSLNRELENATDLRITESGDFRITNLANFNLSQGILSATGFVVGFEENAYVKFNGLWRTMIPYVKHEDSWKEPASMYKKVGTNWVRVY